MSVEVVTFGCRLNAYESEAIKARAGEAQLRDAVVVNTCAVTAEAVRQSRQAIRRLKREQPGAPHHRHRLRRADRAADLCRHAGSRCGARQCRKADARRPMPISASAARRRIRVNDIMSVRETAPQMVDHFDGQTRAFLQVQNGCDHRCTFCIIPYRPRQFAQRADGRGGGGSAPPGRKGLCRDRADRRGPDLLWRRPAGRARAGHAGAQSC